MNNTVITENLSVNIDTTVRLALCTMPNLFSNFCSKTKVLCCGNHLLKYVCVKLMFILGTNY